MFLEAPNSFFGRFRAVFRKKPIRVQKVFRLCGFFGGRLKRLIII